MGTANPTVLVSALAPLGQAKTSTVDNDHQARGCALCNFISAAPLGRAAMALSYVELLRLFDTRQRATLVRLLKSRGIRFMHDRRGRPITTESEINRALNPKVPAMAFTKPPTRSKTRRGGTSDSNLAHSQRSK